MLLLFLRGEKALLDHTLLKRMLFFFSPRQGRAFKRLNIAFQGAIRAEKGNKTFSKVPIAFLRVYCPLYIWLRLLRVLKPRRQPIPSPVAAVFSSSAIYWFPSAMRLRRENPFPIPRVGQAWLGGTTHQEMASVGNLPSEEPPAPPMVQNP